MSDMIDFTSGLTENQRSLFFRKEREYYNMGYNAQLSFLFSRMDALQLIPKPEEKTDEEKQYDYQKELDNDMKQKIYSGLDLIIKTNQIKLNHYFHIDNPNGFSFPDEIWNMIKSYNPPEPKKLPCIKDWNNNKIRYFPYHRFINPTEDETADWSEYGEWYICNKYLFTKIGQVMEKMRDWDDNRNSCNYQIWRERMKKMYEVNDCCQKDIKNYIDNKVNLQMMIDAPYTSMWCNSPNRRDDIYESENMNFIHISFPKKNTVQFRCIIMGRPHTWDHNIRKRVMTGDDYIIMDGKTNKKYKQNQRYKFSYKQIVECGMDHSGSWSSMEDLDVGHDFIPIKFYAESVKDQPDNIIMKRYNKMIQLLEERDTLPEDMYDISLPCDFDDLIEDGLYDE